MAVWKITINGTEHNWKDIDIHRKLIIDSPTSFSATIEYPVEAIPDVNYMDVVRIYRNDVIEWKGYVEKKNPKWDKDGLYLFISGRDATMILWKKYSDDFTKFAEKTAGFFGTVNPLSLLDFIIHTPKSDIGIDYAFNKEGWGLDFVSRFNACETIETSDSQGSPEWVLARQRGYGWLNTGRPTLSNGSTVPNGCTLGNWTVTGTASSPYIHGNLPDQSSYSNYVKCTGVAGQVIIFPMGNVLFQANQSVVNASLTISFKYTTLPNPPRGNGFKAEIYLDSRKTEAGGGWFTIASELYSRIPAEDKWFTKTFDISQYLNNKNDLSTNALKIRISTNAILTPELDVSVCRLNVTIGTNNYQQNSGDFFTVNLKPDSQGNYPRTTAIYFESRARGDAFPRSYVVYGQKTDNTWIELIGNTTIADSDANIDCIHTFTPAIYKAFTIMLTADKTGVPWGVSQVYIYKAEDNKYKPCLLNGEIDASLTYPSRPQDAPNVYTYAGGPYIKGFSNLCTQQPKPIGPLNISRQRLLDAVNYIVNLCSSTTIGENNAVGFSPYEWWLALDDANTFCISNRRGQDKSATIKFESGDNLGSCSYEGTIDNTVQKVYVVGQGEQKKLEDTSLWVTCQDADGTATNGKNLSEAEKECRTFFEDVITDKTIIMNDNDYPAIANVQGSSHLSQNAMPRLQITAEITKDIFPMNGSLPYDVGDTVYLNDKIRNVTGNFRIQNIDISVAKGKGEQTTVTLGYPNYNFNNEMQKLYRRLKSLDIVGTFINDWTAEGTDKKLINAKQISAQSQYAVNAQNDKISQSIPYNGNNWKTTDTNLTDGGYTVGQSDNFLWSTNNTWFGMQAKRDSKAHKLQVALTGQLVQYHNGTDFVDREEATNVHMYWNPHMIMDIKCCDGNFYDLAGATWKYDHWAQADYARIGLADPDATYGFWFFIIKVNSNADGTPAVFDVYCQWSLPDGTKNFNASAYTTSRSTNNGAYLRTINGNQRYKIELQTQCDPNFIRTQVPNVKFNMYEYKNSMTTNNQGMQLTYTQLAYPAMGICNSNSIYNMILKPLYCEYRTAAFSNNSNVPASVYFYNYQTDWKVYNIDYDNEVV